MFLSFELRWLSISRGCLNTRSSPALTLLVSLLCPLNEVALDGFSQTSVPPAAPQRQQGDQTLPSLLRKPIGKQDPTCSE